jgi:uncharacterized membrane protein
VKKLSKARFIAHCAIIAAVYAVLTVALAPVSYGLIQVRVSEALTLLAGFTPAAIYGLFAGCLIANIFTGNIIDIVLGSLTTLAAAIMSYKLRRRPWLVPLPPVLANALVVGCYLTLQHGGLMWLNMLTVGLGQVVSCYIIPFYAIVRFRDILKKITPYVQY